MFKLQKQQGSATIITLVTMMILSSMGALFFMLTTSNMATTIQFQNTVIAQYAAEAGAREAIAMFSANVPNWDSLSTETQLLDFEQLYVKAEITPNLTGSQLPVQGVNYQVKATGTYKKSAKIITFTVTVIDEHTPLLISAWE